jgi:hypothetical protein
MTPQKEPLDPAFLQKIVIDSTPDPGRFKQDSDPAVATLFDLGVVGAIETTIFVRAVKNRLNPWTINDGDVASSPATTVQQAADSLAQNAQ